MSRTKKTITQPRLSPGRGLIDTHCHLDMLEAEHSPSELLERAAAGGVTQVITIGIDVPSSRRACELAALYQNVFATVGIHPHHATELDSGAEKELAALAQTEKVVAYGEIGIDTVKQYAAQEVQRHAFSRQLAMARELQLPVVIHDREAHEEIFQQLMLIGPLPHGGVIHCFSGDATTAARFIDLGFYISFPGVVTFRNAEMLQEAARTTPLERILVETDAPFLAPVPFRGKTNEPLFTIYTAAKIAELKGLSLDEVAEATTANTRRLFSLPAAGKGVS